MTALRPSRQLPLSWSGKRKTHPGKKDAVFLNQYTCAREDSRCVSTMSTASVGSKRQRYGLNYCTFEPASDECISDDHGTAKRILSWIPFEPAYLHCLYALHFDSIDVSDASGTLNQPSQTACLRDCASIKSTAPIVVERQNKRIPGKKRRGIFEPVYVCT